MKNSVKAVLIFLACFFLVGAGLYFTGSIEDGLSMMGIAAVVVIVTLVLESFARKGR